MPDQSTSRWAQLRDQHLQSPEARERYERTHRVLGTIQVMIEAIERQREAEGLSKAALARRIGAPPAAVQRLLRSGPADPTLRTLLEMMDALGIHVRLDAAPRQPNGAARDRQDAIAALEPGRSPLPV